jgi:hypothetical protein
MKTIPDEKKDNTPYELKIKTLLETISPFIERHTSAVCPSCENVCCIDRHGSYETEDLIFLEALGTELPGEKPKDKDTEPCRFLTSKGCRLPRWKRPFRCTWYFCPPLLETMPKDNPKEYRKFTGMLQKLLALRRKLLGIAER